MTIETRNLCFSFGRKQVLNNIDLRISDGEFVTFLGPNGVGKTTLFRNLLGFLPPSEGEILVDGKPIETYSKKELAKCIAYIPQSYSPAFNHSVLDSVLMGTANQIGTFESPSKEHENKAMALLDSLGIAHLAHNGSMNISGGERQLMLICRALLQDARILIMDEPTANLDFGNSFRVMNIISDLAKRGYSILLSTHDPNLALSFSTRVIAMKGGSILQDCKPSEISSEILGGIYNVNITVCDTCKSIRVRP